MFEKLEHCPVCQNNSFGNYIVCNDFTVTQESFAIVSCNKCGFKFTNPRPDEEHLNKYYQSENYISHSNKNNNLINIVYRLARKITIKDKVKLITRYVKPGMILDYGCGTGEFLHACKKRGWAISGLEPATVARDMATKLTNEKVVPSLEGINTEDKFDVITLWHVLEHVPRLNETISKLKSKMKKKGILVIAVPNHQSYDASLYKEFWAGYDVPRHLYHFDQQTIKLLMSNHKMKLVDTIAQKLDAYYVSLLSQKYKAEKNNYFKAIKIGFKSNKFAQTKNQNYSSLIYVFKKA